MPFLSDTVICFDLDDTLYKEIDYLKSAYGEVAAFVGHPEAVEQMVGWYQSGENSFKNLIDTYRLGISVSDCLKIYRSHYPNIRLEDGLKEYLEKLKKEDAKLGIISDGRTLTQRNKIKGLGLEGFFDVEIISEEFGTEKPCLNNYKVVMEKFPERERFIYVGDNPSKDFITPNRLNWTTYCLKDDGRNIHRQDMTLPKEYLPLYFIPKIIGFLGN